MWGQVDEWAINRNLDLIKPVGGFHGFILFFNESAVSMLRSNIGEVGGRRAGCCSENSPVVLTARPEGWQVKCSSCNSSLTWKAI